MLRSQINYKLRWRFDYINRPPKYGIWSMATGKPSDSAYSQPKDGLLTASIEGKDVHTKEIKRLADCPGQDFRMFQWVATASMPAVSGLVSYTPRSTLVGLKLITRNEVIEVLNTGVKNVSLITKAEENIKSSF